MDKEISKLILDYKDNDTDFQSDYTDEFLEPLSIWEIKTKDNSTQFNEKFANLMKNESIKLKSIKSVRPTINIDIHDTSSSSTQADFLSKSKNITPTSQNLLISPHFQKANIVQNLNCNYPPFYVKMN